MSILPKLIGLYRQQGYEAMGGYNSHHFEGWGEAPFTKFVSNNSVQGCGGLALQEVMFLEGFGGYLKPARILVIGNALGWSTVALALIFPKAKIVAIDPNQDGNDLTNRIGRAGGLKLEAVSGFSPQDVGGIVQEKLGGKLDLVLIDAIHTNPAVRDDFAAIQPFCHDGTVFVFHDVLHCDLVDSVSTIMAENQFQGGILTRTPSGMAACWKQAAPDFADYIAAFREDAALFKRYRRVMIEQLSDRMSPILEKL